MANFSTDYMANVSALGMALGYKRNFDILKKTIAVGADEVTFFYIDGFVKDGEIQRVMQYLLGKSTLEDRDGTLRLIPYVEVSAVDDSDTAITAVLSGQTLMLASTFGGGGLLLDLRTYPARQTQEPEGDRVMQGARDGFVETLIMNTALLRRRIRDERLTMRHFDVGGSSHTDVVVAYMEGVADAKYVSAVIKKIERARPLTLTMGAQSLAESLVRRRWYNPFPKIRTTERPDTAAASVLEGSVLVFCDTSPEVMILPTAIFDFFEEADDYSFPPLTGSYLRIVRILMLLFSVVVTPLWYLSLEYIDILPEWMRFITPDTAGALPILAQLFLAELALDGLKLASMNTPNMLSNSLSVVGGLILGDFAVTVGWFSPDVIFYMACVSIANFAQQNHELGYAFKFMRVITLTLTAIFGIWGFALGLAVFAIAVATNVSVTGKRHYLYPLIPFDGRAMLRHLLRRKKDDFASANKINK
ncbi:MAG: spore germination protein [Clostridia bacterium]|nr:spore germination protein [Clostridia bacterium]